MTVLTIFSENLILPFEARCAQGRKEKAQPCRAMSLHHTHTHTLTHTPRYESPPHTHTHTHTLSHLDMRPNHTHPHTHTQI